MQEKHAVRCELDIPCAFGSSSLSVWHTEGNDHVTFMSEIGGRYTGVSVSKDRAVDLINFLLSVFDNA